MFRTAAFKPVAGNALERRCSGAWNVHVASRRPWQSSLCLLDRDEAQGLRLAVSSLSSTPRPHTVGEDEEVEYLTNKPVARGLILPTNLSKRTNFHMHVALLMLTRVLSRVLSTSAEEDIALSYLNIRFIQSSKHFSFILGFTFCGFSYSQSTIDRIKWQISEVNYV